MATKEYQLTVSTTSSTYAYSPLTGDLTDYATTIIVKTNEDCTIKIQYSSDGSVWADYETGIDVNDTSYSQTVRLAKYIRVGAINDVGGETDTVSVTLRAVSETPTYASASDVARVLNLRDSAGSRMVFNDSITPTLAEINESILEAEDFVDRETRHAWRASLITYEYHDWKPNRYPSLDTYRSDERMIHANHRQLRTFTSGTHKIEVWNGSEWYDLVANKTEGRGSDYWIDYEQGIIYFTGTRPTRLRNAVRFTYEYGSTTVPHDIARAVCYIVGIDLSLTDEYASLEPEGGVKNTTMDKANLWDKRLKDVVEHYREVLVV